MKILIFGASGPIGFNLFENFKMGKHEVEGTYLKNKPTLYKFHELDVTNKEDIYELTSWSYEGKAHDCAVTSDETILLTADEMAGGHMKVWDIEDYNNNFEDIIPLGWGIFGWVNMGLIIPIFNFLSLRNSIPVITDSSESSPLL